MNRPIKFRAWDKKLLKMVPPFTMPHLLNAYNCEYSNTQREDLTEFNFEGGSLYELMQFTGLLDKNGKEIYEGDLFGKLTALRAVVKYENEQFALHFLDNRIGVQSLAKYTANSEIIGNVYENPQLLSSN